MGIFLGHLHSAQVKHVVQWSFTVFARPCLQKLGWTFHNILSCPRWLPPSPSCNCSSTGFTRAFGRTILGFSFFDLSLRKFAVHYPLTSVIRIVLILPWRWDSEKGVRQVMVWVCLLPSLQSLSLYLGHYVGLGQFCP